jgi:hypothetical protein
MIREVLEVLKPKPSLPAGAPSSAAARVYLIHDPTAAEDSASPPTSVG